MGNAPVRGTPFSKQLEIEIARSYLSSRGTVCGVTDFEM